MAQNSHENDSPEDKPFRFAGVVLEPGETVADYEHGVFRAEVRKHLLLSSIVAVAVAVVFWFGIAPLDPSLLSEYLVGGPLLTSLLVGYAGWCLYWGIKETVPYLMDLSEKNLPKWAEFFIEEGEKKILEVFGVFLAILFAACWICGGSIAICSRRLYQYYHPPVDYTLIQ